MAFSGVELLEPVGGSPQTVWGGGNLVVSADRLATTAAKISVLNATTGNALLYTSIGALGADGSADWNSTRAEFVILSGNRVQIVDGTGPVRSAVHSWAPSHGVVLTDTHAVVVTQIGGEWNAGRGLLSYNAATLGWAGYRDVGNILRAIGRYDNRVFYVNSSRVVTEINPATTADIGPIATLPAIPGGTATRSGDWLWWKVNSTAAPLVGVNVTTGATSSVALTPAATLPAGADWYRWAIHNDVAYRINSDGRTMLAIDLPTGRWLSDELAVIRTGRTGVAVANNKLWIPSTVTP